MSKILQFHCLRLLQNTFKINQNMFEAGALPQTPLATTSTPLRVHLQMLQLVRGVE